MSIEPSSSPSSQSIRWIISGCLGILAVCCVAWMAVAKSVPGGGEAGLDKVVIIMGGFVALDFLALIGLGVWILRPPTPGAVHFLGRWAGKILLFLGLGLATVIFLFATCFAIIA